MIFFFLSDLLHSAQLLKFHLQRRMGPVKERLYTIATYTDLNNQALAYKEVKFQIHK